MSKRPQDNAKPEVSVRGAMSLRGTRWVEVANAEVSAWIPHADIVEELKVKRELASRGLILAGSRWKAVNDQVGNLSVRTDFPSTALIESAGWTGDCFVLPDGTIFKPKGVEPPPIIFKPDLNKCLVGGSLDDWLAKVAEPLVSHRLPSFVLMMPFAAPLLTLTLRQDNFGFELVGPAGCGKSTIQFLMASAMGRITNDGEGKYWDTADATLEGMVNRLPGHAGLAMVVDEMNTFYPQASAASRGKQLKGLSFRLATGGRKDTDTKGQQAVHRLIYLLSANEPLLGALAEPHKDVTQAATSRLMTLLIDESRPNGVFDVLPPETDSRTFAHTLEAAAHANYGLAIREYLKRLVKDRARDEAAVRRTINEDMERFIDRAKITGANGEVVRIAEAFALVYAGGEMAKRYGVLPDAFLCGPSTMAVYQTFLVGGRPPPNFDDLLAEHVQKPGVVDLDETPPGRMKRSALKSVPAFLKSNRRGQLELLVHPVQFDEAIPGWQQLIGSPGVESRLSRDKDHLAVKRHVRTGREDRMVCIIPAKRILAQFKRQGINSGDTSPNH